MGDSPASWRVSVRGRGVGLPPVVARALREFINALGKYTMYPPGHRFATDAAAALTIRFTEVVAERGALTLGIMPRGLLLDGAAVEPIPSVLREFGARLHRKNIGTIHVGSGVTTEEIVEMLGVLSAPDADEVVGRDGWRSAAIRVEPLIYEVLGFADGGVAQDLDDAFWGQLVEAAYGRRLADLDGTPTTAQVAEVITERAHRSTEEARRVFEALASFSSALATRGEHGTGRARKRFTDVLTAISRPTQSRVIAAAPSAATRRHFLADTMGIVPPALLLQLLESVAEADGEPISPQLRWLLGKLSIGADESSEVPVRFTTQVLALIEQWDGIADFEDVDANDARLHRDPVRTVTLGLELAVATPPVCEAAKAMATRGQLAEVLHLVDTTGNDPEVAAALTLAILDPGLLAHLLAAPSPDFAVIERVAAEAGVTAVPVLLKALSSSEDRSMRRRLLELLVTLGPGAEHVLLAQLDSAPWYLARNILGVLGHLPPVEDPQPILRALRHEERRVRGEALKVLIKHPVTRDRAVSDVLESGDEAQSRVALTALGGTCPPTLVSAILGVLGHSSTELRLQAIRLLEDSPSPLVVPHLLGMVRARRGFFRRVRLLPSTPLMLAALRALARRWSNHRPVIPILELAARSSDPDVVAAGRGRE
jgi:hypothetical protein